MDEFRKLPENQRQNGDYFSLICGLIPAAIWIVRLSLTDSIAAISACRRVAAICRQISDDEWADRGLWRTTAEFFELSSADCTNAQQLFARVRQDEGKTAQQILGYVLATWHAGPEEAIHCQLACIDVLLRLFSRTESVRDLILVPYIESYWRHAAQECRFAFRSHDLTVAAIEAAVTVPKAKRIQAILVAAASGFRIRGLEGELCKLRKALSEATGTT
jgi:hypothetical protein